MYESCENNRENIKSFTGEMNTGKNNRIFYRSFLRICDDDKNLKPLDSDQGTRHSYL